MYELLEILHPSYVLRNALYGGVLTGLVLPLIGILMYARKDGIFGSRTATGFSHRGGGRNFFPYGLSWRNWPS